MASKALVGLGKGLAYPPKRTKNRSEVGCAEKNARKRLKSEGVGVGGGGGGGGDGGSDR